MSDQDVPQTVPPDPIQLARRVHELHERCEFWRGQAMQWEAVVGYLHRLATGSDDFVETRRDDHPESEWVVLVPDSNDPTAYRRAAFGFDSNVAKLAELCRQIGNGSADVTGPWGNDALSTLIMRDPPIPPPVNRQGPPFTADNGQERAPGSTEPKASTVPPPPPEE